MSAPVGSFAWHLEQLGEHPCCWIVTEREQCGLWCGHDGECLPYVAGGYLPEPLLHPLDLLRLRLTPWWRWRCPLCGADVRRLDQEPEAVARQDGDGWRESDEAAWRFWPCGCRAREVEQ